jgi:hypothetical protein
MTRPPVRQLLGWVFAALGVAALFLGWYGVSGTALTAKQIPYVVSGGLTGTCLLVLSAAAFAADDVGRRLDRLDEVERKVDQLYRLLTEEVPEPVGATVSLVALDGGTSYHLPSCRLVDGKPAAHPVDADAVTARGLRPCRLCEPPGVQVA